MTFSLVAQCAETGMFGIAISSSSPAVAARCVHTRAGVGAVASQNVTDPRLGPQTLDLMAKGTSGPEAVAQIVAQGGPMSYRQILAVDGQGRVGLHSGADALGTWSDAKGAGCVAAGNLLANAEVPQAMVAAFASTTGHLGDRLITALQAGHQAGGEAGPVHSAGLQIVHDQSWPLVDLRCDWTEACPITDLTAAWAIYKPQMADYVARALNPDAAPSYGVPGDL